MRFDAVSLFPEMFQTLTSQGISARALQNQLYSFNAWNPRDFTQDARRTVDDRPYGGGPGMVMMAEPLTAAISAAKSAQLALEITPHVICLSPQGQPLTQSLVASLGGYLGLILVCGRYEAIDQRVLDKVIDSEISVGDFVMSGGELPAMCLMDALIRRIPGALGDKDSAAQDSFEAGIFDCPHYTRPPSFAGSEVPDVLMNGDHAKIVTWRRQAALKNTLDKRRDLIDSAYKNGLLDSNDQQYLVSLGWQ